MQRPIEIQNLSPEMSEMIDNLVKKGFYRSRSEFIRESCKKRIVKYLEMKILKEQSEM